MEIVSTKAVSESQSIKDSDTENLSGQLWDAVCENDVDAVAELIRRGAEVDYTRGSSTCLDAAVDLENLPMAELLLKHGANPRAYDGQGFTLLANAIVAGRLDLVGLLLDYGAHINGRSSTSGYTPLMDAIIEKQPVIFDYLLSRGADPNATDYSQRNTFDTARRLDWPIPPDLVEKPKENILDMIGRDVKGWFQKK